MKQGMRRGMLFFVAAVALVAGAMAETKTTMETKISYEGGEVGLLEFVVEQHGLFEPHVRKVFEYFDNNRERIANPHYVTIVDYSLTNKEPRMFVIDMRTGEVEKRLVSHGAGRGEKMNPRDIPIYFSNEPGSRVGSLGFYITGDEYPSPKFERALNLHGQEVFNDNAFERRIVFHGADYVDEEKGVVGRSWGCPAVDNRHAFRLIDQLKDGSLFYIANERDGDGA